MRGLSGLKQAMLESKKAISFGKTNILYFKLTSQPIQISPFPTHMKGKGIIFEIPTNGNNGLTSWRVGSSCLQLCETIRKDLQDLFATQAVEEEDGGNTWITVGGVEANKKNSLL